MKKKNVVGYANISKFKVFFFLYENDMKTEELFPWFNWIKQITVGIGGTFACLEYENYEMKTVKLIICFSPLKPKEYFLKRFSNFAIQMN